MRLVSIILFIVIFLASNIITASLRINRYSTQDVSRQKSIIAHSHKQKSKSFSLTKQTEKIVPRLRLLRMATQTAAPNPEDIDLESRAKYLKVVDEDSDVVAAIDGALLNYPNPYSINDDRKTTIVYKLSKQMTIDIEFYDMQANRIFQKTLLKGNNGTFKGLNYVEIGNETFDNTELAAGVYFYYVIHNEEVLGKGKMAVVP